MILSNIQSTAKTLLDAATALSGVPIISDDGDYPKVAGREDALRDDGLVIIVWPIESIGLASEPMERTGHALMDVLLPITIEENVAVNSAGGGTGISGEDAVEAVLANLIGKGDGTGQEKFIPDNPPFRNAGKDHGTRQWVVLLRVRVPTNPATP